MNWREATLQQLVEIIFVDEEVSLSTKAEAMTEYLRRNRRKKAFGIVHSKIRRIRRLDMEDLMIKVMNQRESQTEVEA